MKKIAFLILIFSILFGCKSQKTIEFCEGVSPEGEGVSCGDKFSTGEITVLIKPESGFSAANIDINIYKKLKYKNEKIDSRSLKINPEETIANTNIYFYDEGDFILEVNENNKKIAEGSVSIVDGY